MTKETSKAKKTQKAEKPVKKSARQKEKPVSKSEKKAFSFPRRPKDDSFKFFEGIGRRKTAIARARVFPGQTPPVFEVNGRDFQQYFQITDLWQMAKSPLNEVKIEKGAAITKRSFDIPVAIIAKVRGGGIFSQAEALRLAISRALVKITPESYKKLRKAGYLTRDPRMRERKKFGLKRARRAPQWQKR